MRLELGAPAADVVGAGGRGKVEGEGRGRHAASVVVRCPRLFLRPRQWRSAAVDRLLLDRDQVDAGRTAVSADADGRRARSEPLRCRLLRLGPLLLLRRVGRFLDNDGDCSDTLLRRRGRASGDGRCDGPVFDDDSGRTTLVCERKRRECRSDRGVAHCRVRTVVR